jgi:hypothetical protein
MCEVDASSNHAMKRPPLRFASHGLVALLLCSAGALAAPARHVAARSPVGVTAAFYDWYITKFRSDHDPMFELRSGAQAWVSAKLLDEVDANLDEHVSDDDEFLHVDDVVRPCHSLEATPLGEGPDGAEVAVTLGARTTPPWQLRVSLVKEGGAWRIRRVAKDKARPSPAAARRALSDC